MSAFAGIVFFDGRPNDRRARDRLATLIRKRSAVPPRVQVSDRAILAHCDAALPGGEREALFAASVRLDNRREIATQAGTRADLADSALVERHFERLGDAGIEQLHGAFAFASWHEATGRLTLARDCLGQRSLFFHRGDGFVAFASLLADLLALPWVPRELDETMMAHFLALNSRREAATLYRGIERVPSRSIVELDAGSTRRRHYWSPRLANATPARRAEEDVERARALFDTAVRRCLDGQPRVAISTSGGLDSSAIAATAARMGHGEVHCYVGIPTAGFAMPPVLPSRYPDERPKLEALHGRYPSLHVHYLAPSGPHRVQTDPTGIFAQIGTPLRNIGNMAWFAAIPDAARADGHAVLISGAMGNFGLSWHGSMSLAELLRHGRTLEMLREARAEARRQRLPVWRVVAREAMLMGAPASLRAAIRRLISAPSRRLSDFSPLRAEARLDLGLDADWAQDGFDPNFREEGGAAAFRSFGMFDHNQIGRDLTASFVETQGLEFRDPHADRDLLEFCLQVPEWRYRREGTPRWFARQVFADRLPAEILHEHRRGLQVPNWFEHLTLRKREIGEEIERLDASAMARRLIDIPRLKRIYAAWPKDAAEAERNMVEHRLLLDRAVHAGRFIRWVEGGNG